MNNNSNYNKNAHRIEPIILKGVIIPANRIRPDGSESHPRNFSGKVIPPYNKNGERNFAIIVDPEQVDIEDLISKGWNIRQGSVREDDPDFVPNYYLRIKVKFHPEDSDLARLNPRVIEVSSKGELQMDERNIGDLDNAEIIKANMTISGRWSESQTYVGVSAYLKKMVVRVNDEDDMSDLMEGIMDDGNDEE